MEVAFCSEELEDALVYFYCHAKTDLDINDKISDSYIRLTDEEHQLTMRRLESIANDRNFTKEPLVFINACEAGGMSPFFYYGFMPYFIAKGSRGIMGTLCKVPAVFASEFAIKFLERFLKGDTAGRILVELRKEFLKEHHNLLGLSYVSYGLSNLSLGVKIETAKA